MAQEALDSADLKMMKANAKHFEERYPGAKPLELAWGERLFDREARDAFAMASLPRHKMAIAQLGARPCIRCGEVTTAFCEGCAHPKPFALCSKCDAERLLCHRCVSDGKIWSQVANHDPDTMEVTGWTDDQGNFVVLDPPLRLKTSEVPFIDGVMDIEFVSRKIKEHWVRQEVDRRRQAAAPSSASG